ncbi:flagellar hook capping FlgD N-terminal domain-containing protein [Pseudovibrio sp. Tun.PSC04-5.I4]|uniref:flagellar hook assembly protein FlgD n=1 Tax=Pseudovibrio sp. Tun.PSC04-5.I4 TaxID=1798213 RepID=UPI00087F7E04|nr:flagellar hook capping FlgD N-terminal domain-containing protein [Pseudovibrio sp. Tun.PSC04-5.I4]SDR33877.1 flagellar basal-body rod modification protein FlgD [Pseudovibrio sp. Tun.PSC04-5.I4]
MTTINSLSPSADTSTSGTQTQINANFDLFISMLTTQIQNQDPLDPMDSSEYTNQLVQYSMVEQQVATTSKLDEQLTQLKTQSASQFVNYIGKEVTAQGATTQLKDDAAAWNLKAASAGTATVSVKNDEGAVIYEREVTLVEGDNSFAWDGVGTNGTKQADGAYSIDIVTKDKDDAPFAVQTEIKGKVDAIDFSSGDVILKMGDVDVPVGNVTGVNGII